MNKSIITFFTLTIVITYGLSCSAQDDNDDPSHITSEKYEACCGAPTEVNREIIPGVNIFIPNVFTPNRDGINDYFYPVYDTTSVLSGSVLYFTIFNSNNDSIKRSIFNREWFNPKDIKNYAFDGNYFKDNNERALWEGQFWYSMNILIEGKGEFKIKGSACSIVCDEESAIFKDKAGCFFPVQVTESFKGDNKLSNKETECFK